MGYKIDYKRKTYFLWVKDREAKLKRFNSDTSTYEDANLTMKEMVSVVNIALNQRIQNTASKLNSRIPIYDMPMKREYIRKHITITDDGQYIPDEELVRSTMKEIDHICNDHSIPVIERYKEINAYNISAVAGYLSQSENDEQWKGLYIIKNILVLAILLTNTKHRITHPDKLHNFLIEWMDDHEDYLKNLMNDYDIGWMIMYMEIAGQFSKVVKAVLKKEEDVKINNIS